MKKDLKLLQNINIVNNSNLFLPNSVSIIKNKIVIADGGNNRVCILNNCDDFQIAGDFGLGRYKLKEPVYATISDNIIYICDWHNHRIVMYDYKTKQYLSEIGIYSNKYTSYLKNITRLLLLQMPANGAFILSHFPKDITNHKTTIVNRINNFVESFFIMLTILIILILK